MAEERKQELIVLLANQRTRIDNSSAELKSELSVRKKLKQAAREHRLPLIGVAALLGFAILKPKRPKMLAVKGSKLVEVKRKKGLLSHAFRLAITFVRPTAARFALLKVKDVVEARLGGGPVTHSINSVLGGQSQK